MHVLVHGKKAGVAFTSCFEFSVLPRVGEYIVLRPTSEELHCVIGIIHHTYICSYRIEIFTTEVDLSATISNFTKD